MRSFDAVAFLMTHACWRTERSLDASNHSKQSKSRKENIFSFIEPTPAYCIAVTSSRWYTFYRFFFVTVEPSEPFCEWLHAYAWPFVRHAACPVDGNRLNRIVYMVIANASCMRFGVPKITQYAHVAVCVCGCACDEQPRQAYIEVVH